MSDKPLDLIAASAMGMHGIANRIEAALALTADCDDVSISRDDANQAAAIVRDKARRLQGRGS